MPVRYSQNIKLHLKKLAMPTVAAFLVLASSWAGFAEKSSVIPQTNGEDQKHFQMKRDGEAFIRLNQMTGEMSTCKLSNANLVCRMAADDRMALQEEIFLLQDRVDELELRMKNNDLALLPNTDPEPDLEPVPRLDEKPDLKKEEESTQYLDEELDKVMTYSTKVLRRFFTVMKELREDLEK